MSKFLYPCLLSNAKEYRQAEAFWRTLWNEVTERAGQAGEWRFPWMKNEYADGTAVQDGNPIFSAVADKRKMGVRIIQEEKTSPDHVELDYWVDRFGEATDPSSI